MKNNLPSQRESPNQAEDRASLINLKGILIFAVIVLALMLSALGSIKLVFNHWNNTAQRNDKKISERSVLPVVASQRANFPLPREQVTPREDLLALQKRENGELNSYGWVDRQARIIRIPIVRAMALLLEKGLPVRTNINQAATGPSSLELQQRRPSQNNSIPQEESR